MPELIWRERETSRKTSVRLISHRATTWTLELPYKKQECQLSTVTFGVIFISCQIFSNTSQHWWQNKSKCNCYPRICGVNILIPWHFTDKFIFEKIRKKIGRVLSFFYTSIIICQQFFEYVLNERKKSKKKSWVAM